MTIVKTIQQKILDRLNTGVYIPIQLNPFIDDVTVSLDGEAVDAEQSDHTKLKTTSYVGLSGATAKQLKTDTNGILVSDYFNIAESEDLKYKADDAENTTVELYEVPAAHEFYIVGLTMSWHCSDVVVGEASVNVAGLKFLYHNLPDSYDGQAGFVQLSFPVPIRMTSTEKIEIVSSVANLVVSGTYVGYEIET